MNEKRDDGVPLLKVDNELNSTYCKSLLEQMAVVSTHKTCLHKVIRKPGGYVTKVMNGKQRSIIELAPLAVRTADEQQIRSLDNQLRRL